MFSNSQINYYYAKLMAVRALGECYQNDLAYKLGTERTMAHNVAIALKVPFKTVNTMYGLRLKYDVELWQTNQKERQTKVS
ncbi:MAG: hypothetical protein K2X69_07580 [Silvanigrellaceae bacterium]|nr:hypothetical protein [Silvanigrellaceae bacterium]